MSRLASLLLLCGLACGGSTDGTDAGDLDSGVDAGTDADAFVPPLECGRDVTLPVGRETCQVHLVHHDSGFGLLWNEFIPSTIEEQWYLSFLDEALRPWREPLELGPRDPTQGAVGSLDWIDGAYVATVRQGPDREVWTVDPAGTVLEQSVLLTGGVAQDVVVTDEWIALARVDRESTRVLRFDRASDRFLSTPLGSNGLTSIARIGDDVLAWSFGTDGDAEALSLWRVGIGTAVPLESLTAPRLREESDLVSHPAGFVGFYTDFTTFRAVSLDARGAILESHPVGFSGPNPAPVAVRSEAGDIGVVWHGAEEDHLASPEMLMFTRVDEQGRPLAEPVPLGPPVPCGPGSLALAATDRGFVVASGRRANFARAQLVCR